MQFYEITSIETSSNLESGYNHDTLYRSTQFKFRNGSFSNENGSPGILLAFPLFKMHLKNVLVRALVRDSLKTSPGENFEFAYENW